MKGYWSEGFLGHDAVEIFARDFSTVRSCSLQHFLKFLHVHGLSEFFGHSSNVVGVNDSWMIIIEKVEDFVDTILI